MVSGCPGRPRDRGTARSGDLTHGDLPHELTTVGRFLGPPQSPQVPAEIRGKPFVIVEAIHDGAPALADAQLAPLRGLRPDRDNSQPITLPGRTHMNMHRE